MCDKEYIKKLEEENDLLKKKLSLGLMLKKISYMPSRNSKIKDTGSTYYIGTVNIGFISYYPEFGTYRLQLFNTKYLDKNTSFLSFKQAEDALIHHLTQETTLKYLQSQTKMSSEISYVDESEVYG